MIQLFHVPARVPSRTSSMMVMLVYDSVALTARDQPAVDGKRGGAGDQKGDYQASPEEGGVDPSVNRKRLRQAQGAPAQSRRAHNGAPPRQLHAPKECANDSRQPGTMQADRFCCSPIVSWARRGPEGNLHCSSNW